MICNLVIFFNKIIIFILVLFSSVSYYWVIELILFIIKLYYILIYESIASAFINESFYI